MGLEYWKIKREKNCFEFLCVFKKRSDGCADIRVLLDTNKIRVTMKPIFYVVFSLVYSFFYFPFYLHINFLRFVFCAALQTKISSIDDDEEAKNADWLCDRASRKNSIDVASLPKLCEYFLQVISFNTLYIFLTNTYCYTVCVDNAKSHLFERFLLLALFCEKNVGDFQLYEIF